MNNPLRNKPWYLRLIVGLVIGTLAGVLLTTWAGRADAGTLGLHDPLHPAHIPPPNTPATIPSSPASR